MPIGPLWGSKCWRTLTIVIAILLLVWSITTMISAYFSGSPLWWYQSTIVLFAITLFGLVLLVKEGLDAFNNAAKYGVRPDKSKWEGSEILPETVGSQTDYTRSYDEPE